jgi:hypothetical protein
MRKTLLASAAILGTASGAWAQIDATPSLFQSQGQLAMPWSGGPAPNDNNNALGIAAPGSVKTPTPGSVVIRLNGRVYAEGDLSYSSVGRVAPGTYGAGTPGFKLNPVGMATFFRLYPGIDGLASNGLRYGAAVEIRQNFMGGDTFGPATVAGSQTQTTGAAASASGNSSSETLFVRRAFTYIGSDQVGIVRVGQGDGVVGLFDYTGIFTTGSWDGGIGNILNSGLQAVTPNNYLISWGWLSGNGVEYGNSKIVYMSPQFFGLDIGLEYDPNQGNSFSNSATSQPLQTGPCLSASADCIGLTSGNDGTRWYNRVAGGVRYMANFGGLDVKAYGVYITSSVESAPVTAQRFNPLNEFNGGIALSYLGITVNADATAGKTNGSNALMPSGGAPMHAVLGAISYAAGPISFGAIVGMVDSQGSNALIKGTPATVPGAAGFGASQRHELAAAIGGAYKLAPGITLAAEYQYVQKHQGGFNFVTGTATGTKAFNDIKSQGIQIATIVSW